MASLRSSIATRRSSFQALLFLAGVMAVSPLLAQQPNPPPPAPAPQPNPSPSPSPQQQPSQQTGQDFPRVLFLNGTVLMGDGSPLPRDVNVELICTGRVIQKTSVTADGHFSFDLGGTRHQMMADASMSGSDLSRAGGANGSWGGLESAGVRSAGLGRVDLGSCDVRIPPTPGFHANLVHLRTRSIFDNPDIGAIVLHRISDTQGTVISLNSLKAPGKANKSFRKAGKELARRKPRLDQAILHLEKAVELYPEFAEAWNAIGQIRLQAQDESGARQAFQRAIEVEARFLGPYLNLAKLEIDLNNWDAAVKLTARLVELSPYLPDSHFLDGVANYYSKNFGRAEESLRVVQERSDTQYSARTHLFLGMIVAEKGEYREAATCLRFYLNNEEAAKVSPKLRDYIESQLKKWQDGGLIDSVSG